MNSTKKVISALTLLTSAVIISQGVYASSSAINPTALKLAMNGYQWAIAHDPNEIKNRNILTIVDFTKGSNQQRMWVINPNNDHVLMSLYVAQGKNSGLTYATQFSNQPRSEESSLGVYATGDTYEGKHGEELSLYGLERGINNNAYSRAIIIHSAEYMTPEFIREHGRAGRSWGCFAVDPAQIGELIHLVKGGSVIFAYGKPEIHDRNVA